MQIVRKLRHIAIRFDQRIRKLQRMRRRETNATDAIDLRNRTNQQREVCNFNGAVIVCGQGTLVGIYILAK